MEPVESQTEVFQKATSSGKGAIFLYVGLAVLGAAVPGLSDMTLERWNALSVFQQAGFFLGIALSALTTLKASTSSSTRPK